MIEDQTKFTNKNCIKFVERTNEANWVRIMDSDGCWSQVGRKKENGPQIISLEKSIGCVNKETVTHQLLHSLGFIHEHQRPDRDDWIEVRYDNIKNGIVYFIYYNITIEVEDML